MRAIAKLLTTLLVVMLLLAVIPPAFAKSDSAPSSSDLIKLKGSGGKSFNNYNQLISQLANTERQVVKYFEKRGALPVGSTLTDKTLTNNFDGTWTVTIYVTVPPGLYANVYDYLTNLQPIPGTFNIAPRVVGNGYVEWDGLPAGSYTLQFKASQGTSGYTADQANVWAYGFGGFGGFISSDRAVGFWFDI